MVSGADAAWLFRGGQYGRRDRGRFRDAGSAGMQTEPHFQRIPGAGFSGTDIGRGYGNSFAKQGKRKGAIPPAGRQESGNRRERESRDDSA